jgi:hypothetical protein
MKIPLSNGTEFDLDPFIAGFKAKYPHVVDMDAEFAKIHLWLHRNPSRHPAAPFRFVDNWLKKLKPKMIKLHIAAGGKLTEHEVISLANKLGTQPRPGESYAQLAKRLSDMQENRQDGLLRKEMK